MWEVCERSHGICFFLFFFWINTNNWKVSKETAVFQGNVFLFSMWNLFLICFFFIQKFLLFFFFTFVYHGIEMFYFSQFSLLFFHIEYLTTFCFLWVKKGEWKEKGVFYCCSLVFFLLEFISVVIIFFFNWNCCERFLLLLFQFTTVYSYLSVQCYHVQLVLAFFFSTKQSNFIR